jgi:hypothetical protein
MKNLMFSKKQTLIACFALLICSSLHAQPFPPAPWPIPPDTSHYTVTNSVGQQVSVRRPPDSMMIPATLMIRFRPGALDSGILSETYWTYFYGHNAKHKGGMQTLSGGDPYDGTDEPRGFYPDLRSLLFADRFGFDSSNNIVKDTLLRNFLIANLGNYLHRFTAASPLDTLTITTQGDTVPCDLPNWMVLSFDSTINPLFLGYLLTWEFPNDIAMAYPGYFGGQLYGPPNDLYYTLGYERNIRMIEADTAWNYEVGDSLITVEVADAGLDYQHPDFGDTVVGNGHKWEAIWNYDYNNLGVDSTPDHGTAMSGIIGALSNNVIGMFSPFDSSVAGIAGGRGTLPLHTPSLGRGVTLAGYITNISFDGTPTWDPSIFEAASKSPNTHFGLGVHIINCSEGFPAGYGGAQPEDVYAALNYAYLNGVVFVAAVGEAPDTSAGTDTVRNYPSDYDDPWVISVGGSTDLPYNKEKIQQSNFGYTLDLLAPAGASDYGTNPFALNYTTRQLTSTSPPTYGAYGGTSAAAANVSGSAALLLSHYIRTSSGLSNIEPEDIQNILKASAWRGDTERLAHPDLAESWVPHNGYGHLDIGHAFEMLDSNITGSNDAGYKLYHASFPTVPVLDTGAWGAFQTNFQFSPAWQWRSAGDTFAIPLIQVLPVNLAEGYRARARVLTYTFTLPDTLENSDTCPLFVWGRSGGAGQPSGWSFANAPNFETGWTKVTNGLGSDPDSLMDGIFAPSSKIIHLETVQYDVYGWVDSTGNYSHYYGHCPPDPLVAVNFSYFGRPKQPASIVQEGSVTGSDSLNVTLNPSGTILANFSTNSGLPNAKIEVLDVLGRVMVESTIGYAKAGWNSAQFSSTNFPSGAYFCVVMGEDYLQVKNFLLIK